MRYILLLILAACGGPGWVSEQPSPPVGYEPEKPQTSAPIAPPEVPVDLDKRIKLLDWDVVAPTRLCFKWNPQDDADGFKLFVSAESGVYGEETLAGVSAGDVFRACAAGLEQGKQYYAIVIAYNNEGLESEPSDELPFIAPYVIQRSDLKLVNVMREDGVFAFGFTGPANVMEANLGHVEWSPDLITWTRIDVPWVYDNGMHSFAVPSLAPSAFFRLGFTRGVVSSVPPTQGTGI